MDGYQASVLIAC